MVKRLLAGLSIHQLFESTINFNHQLINHQLLSFFPFRETEIAHRR